MQYTIKNETLSVTADTSGAELRSIRSAEGVEYLWQGDPAYWTGHAPNLFPYIARLTDGKHVYKGKTYEMKIHGLLKYSELVAEKVTEQEMTFRLDSNPETLERYPFEFTYRITYRVEGDTLKITNTVENTGHERMFFGIGGHPGFNVPLEEGLTFEDYVLEFPEESHPTVVGFTEDVHVSGQDRDYPLVDNKVIPLRHELFPVDALVLKNTPGQVTIHSPKGKRGVEVTARDFAIMGFWHKPNTDAPYVCVEPWSSLPSRSGVIENLSQQSDLVRLDPGKTYENHWSVRVF